MSTLATKTAPKQLVFDFGETLQPCPPTHEPLLTIVEACRFFNLKPHVLRRAIKAGAIPSYRIGNGRIRLRSSDISSAIEASRRGGAQ